MADPVSLAITVALNAATMALTAMQKIEGPRLQDLKASTADYGTPLVQFYGTKRLEAPCIYAEDIREEKHQNKTKGGKYNEYKYFGTWASFIADNPISSVLKIWLDRHLVYDRTGVGSPIGLISGPLGIDFKLGNTNNLRIYLGTEDQLPDPRLLAKIEAREGAGMCPAYLGISYMVFEEVPLEKFGNRMPQVSTIATRIDIPKYPYVQLDTGLTTTAQYSISSGGLWMAVHVNAGEGLEWWHLPTRARVSTSPNSDQFAGLENIALSPDGTAYYFAQYVVGVSVFSALYSVAPLGAPVKTESDSDGAWFANPTRAFGPTTVYTGINPLFRPAGASYLLMGQAVAGDDIGRDFCIDADGAVWGLFEPAGSSANFTITQLTGGAATTMTVTGSVVRGSPGSPVIAFVADHDHFAVITDGMFYAIDRATGAIKTTRALAVVTNNYTENFPHAISFWSGYTEISLVDGSAIRTIAPLTWVVEDSNGEKQYDPVGNAIMVIPQFENHITWRFLDRATGDGWPLGDICADVAGQCGMAFGTYDFSDLDQNVPGYAWTQGAGKNIIGPLLEIFDSDIGPHGFTQLGRKRGQPLSGDTITSDWFVPDDGARGGEHRPLYTIPIASETDLPRRVSATFADPNMEEQPNTASTQRNAASVKTDRETSYDLSTLMIDPNDLQPLLERALRRGWVGATKPEMRLTPKEIRLEPGDVRMLNLEGEVLRCRAVRQNIRANRVLDMSWELDGETPANLPDWQSDASASLHTTFTSPGATSGGRPPDEVPILVPSKGFVLDSVLLFDADDQTSPFLYDAAGPFVQGGFWPGTSVWNADEVDGVYAANWDAVTSDHAITWGSCDTVLPDALEEVFDEGSTLDVRLLGGGSLSSVTEDELVNSQSINLALVGQELVQFRDVELIDTDTYRLTGFIRGVRGSEWAIPDHAAGEYFVLVNGSMRKRTVGASEIGDTDYYKFSSTGDDLEVVETVSVEFESTPQRPLAPCHIELTRNSGTGDWAGTFVRRTRVGGSTVNGQDVPLGESSELYRVRVLNPADLDGTPIRTIAVTAQAFAYTNAQQVTDFGVAQTGLTVEIVQVSPTLSLEGFATRASKVEGPPQRAAVGDLKVENDQAITVAFPTAELLANDVAILHVQATAAFGAGTLALPAPTGFTPIGEVAFAGCRHAAFWRRCDGAETTVDVAATGGGATNPSLRARITLWRGCTVSVDPVEGAATSSGNSASADSPAVTTLGPSRRVVNQISESTDGTAMTPPAGYTEEFESNSTAPFGYQSGSMSVNSKAVAAASTVGSSATTLSTGFFWGVVSFALVPRVP